MINLINEVDLLLRDHHIGGWQNFKSAYRNFCNRHCHNGLTEVDRMNKFWRHVLSNTQTGDFNISNAMSALCHCISGRDWLKNFKNYVFVCLSDINEALSDYLWEN